MPTDPWKAIARRAKLVTLFGLVLIVLASPIVAFLELRLGGALGFAGLAVALSGIYLKQHDQYAVLGDIARRLRAHEKTFATVGSELGSLASTARKELGSLASTARKTDVRLERLGQDTSSHLSKLGHLVSDTLRDQDAGRAGSVSLNELDLLIAAYPAPWVATLASLASRKNLNLTFVGRQETWDRLSVLLSPDEQRVVQVVDVAGPELRSRTLSSGIWQVVLLESSRELVEAVASERFHPRTLRWLSADAELRILSGRDAETDRDLKRLLMHKSRCEILDVHVPHEAPRSAVSLNLDEA